MTTQIRDLLGFLKSLLINIVLKYVIKAVPGFNLPGAVSFNNVLKKGSSLSLTPVEDVLDDGCCRGDDARGNGEGAGEGFAKKFCVQGSGLAHRVDDCIKVAQLYWFGAP